MEDIKLKYTKKILTDSVLFTVSNFYKSKKFKIFNQLLFIIIALIVSIVISNYEDKISTVIFFAICVIVSFFIPYQKILNKMNFFRKYFIGKIMKSLYKGLMDEECLVSFHSDFIKTTVLQVETKYYFGSFENITETEEYIFIKTKNKMVLIFPKSQIQKQEELISY